MDVAEVLAQRGSGVLVLRWGSSRPWAPPPDLPLTALSAADALAAKQLLRVSVLNCSEAVHSQAAGTVPYAAMHTGLTFWSIPSGRCFHTLILCTKSPGCMHSIVRHGSS